jgi:hypothetical protein
MHFDDVKNRNHWKIRASLMMARQKQGVDRSGRKNAGFDSWCYALISSDIRNLDFKSNSRRLKIEMRSLLIPQKNCLTSAPVLCDKYPKRNKKLNPNHFFH